MSWQAVFDSLAPWTSLVPCAETTGRDRLFDDRRIGWAVQHLDGVREQRILELGSLEGGHSYQLARAGAHVTAIEGNPRSYLKGLLTRERLGTRNVTLLPGDFRPYLASLGKGAFDCIFAVGVLYHQPDPLALLRDCTRVAPRLALWTHYADRGDVQLACGGFACLGERREYPDGEHLGGLESYSVWMQRDDVLAALTAYGYRDLMIGFDEPGHPNGPAFMVLATR